MLNRSQLLSLVLYVALLPPHALPGSEIAPWPGPRLVSAGTAPRAVAVLQSTTANMENAIFSPDGRYIAASQNDLTLWIWDWRKQRRVVGLSAGDGFPRSYAWSPDSSRVAIVSRYGLVSVYAWRTRHRIANWRTPPPLDIQFSGDGQDIVTADQDNTVRIWRSGTGRAVAVLKHPDIVDTADFLPGGSRIITASDDGSVRVWDWQRRKVVTTLRSGASFYEEVATVSANGRYVAAGASPNPNSQQVNTDIWDLHTRRLLTVLKNKVLAGPNAFSPDGTYLLLKHTADVDQVWDWRRGKALASLKNGNSSHGLYTAHFSPNGALVVTASGDGQAIVYNWR